MSHTISGRTPAPSSQMKPKREMKILCLGLPRTGTASIAQALETLAYRNVYHGLKSMDGDRDWAILCRAADATFPSLPTYTGKPFTRAQWDELFGACEATTDVSAPFAPQLIRAYPEARVLLVVRDFDAWYRSTEEIFFDMLWGSWRGPFVRYVDPLVSYNGLGMRKITLGFFEARTVDEARANARKAYGRHYRVVQEMVNPENLLVYRLGEGWAPLCKFLGKPVPDVQFPWINETAALKQALSDKRKRAAKAAAMLVLPWVIGAVAVGIGLWIMVRRGGNF